MLFNVVVINFFQNSVHDAIVPLLGTIRDHQLAYAQRRIYSSANRTDSPNFNFDQNSLQKPSSFIEDTQAILPLFQGNILYILPVVVAEYLYL